MSHEQCFCMNLRSAAQQLTRVYDEALAPAGVSANQFSLMNLIRTAENPTMKDLAEASDLDRSTLGRNLRVLEKRSLVAMQVGSDARTRVIALTGEGRAALRRATPLWQQLQDDLGGRLGQKKRSQFRQLLTELTADNAHLRG